MAWWKKILVAVGIIAVVLIGYMSWYLMRHSMHAARKFEVNSSSANTRVLIATQGSAFKDAIVAGVVQHLQPRQVYVNVIDVSALPSVREAQWNAIVVIHTWEMEKPQPDAKKFVDGVQDSRKVIVLTTSGAATRKLDGIDAISSASQMIDVPRRVEQINARIDAILSTGQVR
jgi:ABC-type branched-subunit amino acid transport system substrate-binding protein